MFPSNNEKSLYETRVWKRLVSEIEGNCTVLDKQLMSNPTQLNKTKLNKNEEKVNTRQNIFLQDLFKFFCVEEENLY